MTSLTQLNSTSSVPLMQAGPAYRRVTAIALCGVALILLASIIFITPPMASAADPPFSPQYWSVEQFQPLIKPGGRANTIAVHPNESLILVASESGGLFRSDDTGNNWQHVDSLPVLYTNAVAFLPSNSDIVIATATEDFSVSNHGGIWRSENSGKSWTQVFWQNATTGKINDGTLTPDPSWPCGERFSAYEISMAPETGNIYIADSCGVSISSDQGKSWTHVTPFGAGNRRVVSVAALPKTAGGSGDLLLVGGPSGIRRSTDGGTTWLMPAAMTKPTPDGIDDMHAFGKVPLAKDQAFVVIPTWLTPAEQKTQNPPVTCSVSGSSCMFMILYSTNDAGDTWKKGYVAPDDTCRPGGGCAGGIGFVKAVGSATSYDLYLSNRLLTYYQPNGGSWKPFIKFRATSEAGDTRDIAFNSHNQPILAATDGGLIKHDGLPIPPSVADIQLALKKLGDYSGAITGSMNDETQKALTKYQSDHEFKSPSGTIDQPTIDSLASLWTFAGANNQGNGPNGYDALQIYEVKGQWVGNSYHNLYFGTQDNSLWSSGDTGMTWTRCCNEGGYFEGEYRTASPSDSQITFYASGNHQLPPLLFTCAPNDSNNCWGGDAKWTVPGWEANGGPKIIWKNFHVQGVESREIQLVNPFGQTVKLWQKKGLAFTTDVGKTWKQYAMIDEDRKDLPKLSITPKKRIPILYQVTLEGFDATAKAENYGLARIVKKKNAGDASVSFPDMNNFGEFGAPPTMTAAWHYRVLGVDPRSPNHLIAPDINYGMKETTDSGNNWMEMPILTSLVTEGGQLKFSGKFFFNGIYEGDVCPQASAVSFCPENPKIVAVGTVQNGIFISTDAGKDGTWTKVSGSEQATSISALHWRKPDDIIVSTYGRGLWRVRLSYTMPIIYFQRPPEEQPSPYDHVAVAYGGRIVGVRATEGIVKEIFVEPRTTIAFAIDSRQVPNIRVTESTRPVGFQGVSRIPKPPEGARMITGLTLTRRGEESELVGFLFSPRPRSMYTPEETHEAEERPVGRKESPTTGKPYLEVLTGSVTVPNGTIKLAGRNLGAGTRVEIAFDGNIVQRLVADRGGKFSSAVEAPSQFGIHSLTLIDSRSGRVLNGAMISVRPQDSPRSD